MVTRWHHLCIYFHLEPWLGIVIRIGYQVPCVHVYTMVP